MPTQNPPINSRQTPTVSHSIDSQVDQALEKSDIAELSSTAINRMTCDELLRVVQVAELPQSMTPNRKPALPSGDRETLLRLAHLARRCCQNQGY